MRILTRARPSILKHVFGKLLPAHCLLCGNNAESVLCAACIDDLPPLPAQRCPRCAEATTHGEHCGRCLAHPPAYDGVLAAYRYDFPIDRLVHALKYGGQLALAEWFAGQIVGQCENGDIGMDIVIPMPLHHARLCERGFNQSAEIARAIASRLGLPILLDTCRRTRQTQSQADLPLKERAANVRGAFECQSELSGRRVLLVDDVMTTGATMDECARTLRMHGASSVVAACLARTTRAQ